MRRAKALVVGIDAYPVAPLTGCVNDADCLASLLATNEDGSPNFSVQPLLSSERSIARGTLRSAVGSLFAGDPDVALFYFSGHGYLNAFGGYLVTPDVVAYDEGVPMSDILDAANRSGARNRIIILDCCHAGSLGSPPAIGQRLSQLASGVTVLAACRDDEAALESLGHGVFTALVLDALCGCSADLLGKISPGSIYAYIDRSLGPWAQRPLFQTNVSEFVSLRDVTPPIATAVLRNICRYFQDPDTEFQLDPSYEHTDPSSVPNRVTALKELQKMERVGLVVPVDEEHMYYAAMNSKSCRLTQMGRQYWRLVKSEAV